MMEEELDYWGLLWQEEKEFFDARLKANQHLSQFFVCDRNHRFRA
jgi:hypothetical protein